MESGRSSLVTVFSRWLQAAWRRRYLIAVPVAVMPVLGLLVGLVMPKSYSSHTTILIQDTAKINPFLKDIALSTNLKDRIEGLNALLHSRHILLGVAGDLGMVKADSSEQQRNAVLGQLNKAFSLKLSGSDLISLTLVQPRPDRMEEMLGSAMRRLIERIVAPERSALNESETFLGQQLETRRKELAEAEEKLARYKTEHAIQLPELHVANVQRLNQLRQAMAEKSGELAGSQAAFESMKAKLSQTNPVVGKVEEGIVATLAELALLRARFTDEHSQVQGVLRKLHRLEEERDAWIKQGQPLAGKDLDRLWNLAATANENEKGNGRPLLVSQLNQLQAADARSKALEQEVESLKTSLAQVEKSVSSYGDNELNLSTLHRDVDIRRELYNDLLKRSQMAKVTGSLGQFEEAERIKVIDPPFTPLSPSTPPAYLFALAGLMAGLLLGGGLGVVAELTDITLRHRDEIERLAGAPVLCRVPNLARSLAPEAAPNLPLILEA